MITSALSDRGGSEYRGFKLFDQDGNICLIPEPTHRVHCIASWIAKYFGLSDFLRSIVTLCFFIRGNRSFAYWLRKKHRISFRACPFKEKVTNGRFGTLAFACYVLSCPLRGIPFLRWVLTFLQRNKRLIKYSHRRRRAYAYLMSLSNEEMGNIMEFRFLHCSIPSFQVDGSTCWNPWGERAFFVAAIAVTQSPLTTPACWKSIGRSTTPSPM